MAETLTIDLDSLSIREIKMIETKAGMSFTRIGKALADGEEPVGEILQVIAYMLKKRENPNFAFEDAEDLVISLAEPDPTKPTGSKS